MAILESHRILIGACGWLHDNWQDSFYPEDLPQDWYLGYYGNEYPVVLVREKEWQLAGNVEDWLEETDELPVFICEIPLLDYQQDLLQRAEKYLQATKEMAGRCTGIICQLDSTINVDELKKLLQACQAIAPTVLAMADAPATVQSLMAELAINPLWSGPGDTHSNNGALYVAQLDSSQIKLPELRKTMENLLAQQSNYSKLMLLVDGDSPDLEIVKQAQVMLDLL